MRDLENNDGTILDAGSYREDDISSTQATSRRTFLATSAGLAAGGAVAQALPTMAQAQGAGTELGRLQAARRILLKGGVVLTLDRAVGDFARADVLIEDDKIRQIRPD